MRSSELHALLDRPDDIGGLRTAISSAMPAFRRGLAERGRSAPIVVESEGANLLVTEAHVAHLCEQFLTGDLDEAELEYVASALDLCPDFRCASSAVESAVFSLADPVANGPITRDSVRELLQSMPEARGLTSGCS
jgi:hypothetical protein